MMETAIGPVVCVCTRCHVREPSTTSPIFRSTDILSTAFSSSSVLIDKPSVLTDASSVTMNSTMYGNVDKDDKLAAEVTDDATQFEQ